MKYYNSNTIIYLDGAFEKAVNSSTDLYGQSLHYGYAAFEGIRAYKTHNGNRIFKAAAHFDRLERSCQLANIPFPWDKQELIDATYKLLQLNKLKDAYIRPLVFLPPQHETELAKWCFDHDLCLGMGCLFGQQAFKINRF